MSPSTARLRRAATRASLAVLIATLGCLFAVSPSSPAHADTTPPPIHHIWQIQIENQSYAAAFGPTSAATYLNGTLKPAGVLLAGYYATGHVSLDNYISQLSGEPGNVATFSDCQVYTDFVGDPTLTTGPANPGAGCVYPASVKTLPDQLTATGQTWAGYMEDMGNTPTRETSSCGQPTAGGGSTAAANPAAIPPVSDGTQTATAADQYAVRHNPFVYFHSLIDTPVGASQSPCQTHVTPLTTFAASLTNPPNYSWITPNLCDDAHDAPCKGPDITGANPGPGGMTSADAFLKVVVPEIMASPAYQQGGLIAITFDEGAANDTASCCGEVTGTTGVQPVGGGGLTGALLISPLLTPHTSTVPYNHYSLLRSFENIFGITTGGTDGLGHLGQAGTAPAFGPDVYGTTPTSAVPEVPYLWLLLLPLAAAGAVVVRHHRRRRTIG